MLREFPELENVVPVVRNVEIKYKKPGQGMIRSKASLTVEKAVVQETLETRYRALVPVQVTLYDANAILVMQATFEWFVLINVS